MSTGESYQGDEGLHIWIVTTRTFVLAFVISEVVVNVVASPRSVGTSVIEGSCLVEAGGR